MGAFYGSVQVRSDDRDSVLAVSARVAAEKNIRLLIGPAINGWVGVYPENNGQDERICERFAAHLQEPILQVLVHDDSIFAYWFFRDGALIDTYHSTPGYFGEENRAAEEPRVGNPELFRFLIQDKVPRLARLLDRAGKPIFASETLIGFAKLLKITNAAQAYEYLKCDDRAGVKGWRQFVEIPAEAATDEKKEAQQRATSLRIELAKLKAEKKLLLTESRKDCQPVVCALNGKFFVAWPDYRGTVSFSEYSEPWRSGADIQLDVPAHITSVVTDARASRLAMAARDRVRVWAVETDPWSVVGDVPERDLPISAALPADGTLVAHASRKEAVVTSLVDQRRLCSFPPGRQRQIAFHPEQKLVVFASMSNLGVVHLQPQPTWHKFFVGGLADGISPRMAAAVRAKFQSIDASDIADKTESAIEKAVANLRVMSARVKQTVSDQEVEDVRRSVSTQMAAWAERMKAFREGDVSQLFPPQPKERPHCVGFSRDGKWFWCGTDKGLRVYACGEMLEGEAIRLPEPTWSFDSPGTLTTETSHQVMSVAEELNEPAVIFGTGEGYLYRMSLETGVWSEIIKVPGDVGVREPSLSRDGNTLAIASFSLSLGRPRNRQRNSLQIWSYRSLLAGAVP